MITHRDIKVFLFTLATVCFCFLLFNNPVKEVEAHTLNTRCEQAIERHDEEMLDRIDSYISRLQGRMEFLFQQNKLK